MPTFDIDPSTDPLQIRRALGLPPLTPPTLSSGRDIPVLGPLLRRAAGGLSTATLDAGATAGTPPVAPAGQPSLNPATLSLPDPNDPKYAAMQPHGLKRFGLTLASELGGPFRGIATNALNAPQVAYNRDVQSAKNTIGMQDTESQIAERDAQAKRANEEANKPAAPGTPEEQTIHDLMTGENGGPRINAATGKPYSYLEAYKEMKQAAEKPEKTAEADKPLSDAQITQYNAGLADRYKVLNPGKALPPEFTLQKGALPKDFDRIDKLLQGTESATSTQAQRTQAEQDRKAAQDQKQLTERDKYVQPFKSAVDTATDAESYVNSGKPTGPGDYAMMNQFQEMIVAGQKAGIRFTQAEQTMLRNAQSWADSIRATARHAIGGTYFSDTQRKQILDTMKGIAARAQKSIDDYDSERGRKPAGAGGATVDDLVKKYGRR
jgi:hypothetical protein